MSMRQIYSAFKKLPTDMVDNMARTLLMHMNQHTVDEHVEKELKPFLGAWLSEGLLSNPSLQNLPPMAVAVFAEAARRQQQHAMNYPDDKLVYPSHQTTGESGLRCTHLVVEELHPTNPGDGTIS